jgi:hypothetical protein
MSLHRRSFLTGIGAGVGGLLVPQAASAGLFRRHRGRAACPPQPCCCPPTFVPEAGPPAQVAGYFDARDCTGAFKPGTDIFVGRAGLFFDARVLPTGKFHTFRVVKDNNPPAAYFNFTSPATSFIACIAPPNFYPERAFNQGGQPRIFVYGSTHCFGGTARPLRGCPTAYGWLFEIDSKGSGYDMVVVFIENRT